MLLDDPTLLSSAMDMNNLARANEESVRQQLPRLGFTSLFNFTTYLLALRTDGVGGTMTIRVPPKVGDRLDIEWECRPVLRNR